MPFSKDNHMVRTGVLTPALTSYINQQIEMHESIDKIHRIKRRANYD